MGLFNPQGKVNKEPKTDLYLKHLISKVQDTLICFISVMKDIFSDYSIRLK